ncbi:putative bifunctional diguanylate cyclase/phosphodiesterase [Cryobacterium tagatosivorans]|uniref:Bifunctional diguanylate cyclase/phosphodiesterase n=1 Tax=Cryobacterium tagatosivorans TaxID=1259199 RepID=A0A4R8UBA4_9MICO|nr:bifunctional diguanylate cyclase/phosphodiesterase [Cryobacterium tagatosivorans]TFB46762.1 bifunctional diguanylate cyclase/phosphodiesterase [Cryobacterium tagatosivorans]
MAWYTTGGAALAGMMPGLLAMKPTSALGLVLLSIALVAYARPRVTVVLGVAVFAIGGLSLAEYALGTSLGVDTLLPGIEFNGDAPRMAPSTALSLFVLGGSVMSSRWARSTLTLGLAFVALGVSQIAILGYVYGVSSLYTVGGYTSMALLTAVGIALLSGVILLQHPSVGLAALAGDSGSAGRLVRPAIPFFILGPFALGWLFLTAQRLGWFDTPFAVAALVLSMTILGSALTWVAALRLRELDRQRDGALATLAETNRMLETTVQARTHELAETADALQALVRLAPVGIVQLDSQGGLLTANNQWLSVSGLTLDESLGAGWASALHPDDADRVLAEWGECVSAGTAYSSTVRFRTPDGQVNSVQVTTTPIRDRGTVTGHLASVTDVTALRAAEQAASAARARFEAAFAWSPLGTAIVSLDGRVLEANRRLFELAGRSTDVLGGPIEAVFLPLETVGADARRGGPLESSRQRVDRRMRRSDAEETWVKVSVAQIHEGEHVGGVLYQLEDITARRLAEARVEHLAFHDPLTNLPNRLLLLDRLSQALLQAARHGRGVAVLFIDLDRFKVVNDSLGHHSGDAVLVEVAARLRQGARASDTVARIGGDEFVVVCPDVDSSRDVAHLADALQKSVALPIEIGEHVASVDASIGIAFGVGHDDPEAILRDADQAMYLAKDRGRARYEVFDDDLRGRIDRRLDTEIALRSAVDLGQIETWYQPIVDLRERTVVATEALARWRRPERGLVMPGEFIAIAEEVGLIKEIGSTVLGQACLAATALEGGMAVSVNVSPRQFVRDDFGAVVKRALSTSGLAPNQLWLELTESAVMDAIGSAARTFQELRDLGVRLAIDDFGTGYSSFTHLREFDVDLLKIDMTFVRDIENSARDRAIVEGVVRLADSLKLEVVAEGIETTGQLELLREMGCRYGQGYLFSKPAPQAAPVVHFEGFLASSTAISSRETAVVRAKRHE